MTATLASARRRVGRAGAGPGRTRSPSRLIAPPPGAAGARSASSCRHRSASGPRPVAGRRLAGRHGPARAAARARSTPASGRSSASATSAGRMPPGVGQPHHHRHRRAVLRAASATTRCGGGAGPQLGRHDHVAALGRGQGQQRRLVEAPGQVDDDQVPAPPPGVERGRHGLRPAPRQLGPVEGQHGQAALARQRVAPAPAG